MRRGTVAKLDRMVAERISEHSRVIAFRNILIHGYADVDDLLVWDIVQTKLPVLRRRSRSAAEGRLKTSLILARNCPVFLLVPKVGNR